MKFLKYNFLFFVKKFFLYNFFRYLLHSICNSNKYLNEIYFIEKDGKVHNKIPRKYKKTIKLLITGKRNRVEIHEPLAVRNFSLTITGENNIFKIDKNSQINKLSVSMGKGTNIRIGKCFSCQNVKLLTRKTVETNLEIGDDCMFSYDIVIRTGDSHTIYDINSKDCLNQNADIKIGNHVWIAPRVMIFKDTIIPDNSIVAASSIVTRKFHQENTLYAGVPAKPVRAGINWNVHPPQIWNEIKNI